MATAIERNIDYVADPADGLTAPEDSCVNDYKKPGLQFPGPEISPAK